MLFKPDIKLKSITDISVDILKKYNIESLLLDVDNTMSTHHGQVLTNGLIEWLREIKNAGINVSVLSNSKEKRVKPFANKIGLEYESLALKPLPFGFIRAIKHQNIKRKTTAIVGDQIFTDVLGGGLIGIKRILLTPIKLEDGFSFKIRRKLEKIIFKLYNIKDMEA